MVTGFRTKDGAGPIVMNSKQELEEAFDDLKTGKFIRNDLTFEK